MAKGTRTGQRQIIQSEGETEDDVASDQISDGDVSEQEDDTDLRSSEEAREVRKEKERVEKPKKRRLGKSSKRQPSMGMIDDEAEMSGEETEGDDKDDEDDDGTGSDNDWVEVDPSEPGVALDPDGDELPAPGSDGQHMQQLFEQRLQQDQAKEDALLGMLRERQENRRKPIPSGANPPRRMVQQTLNYSPVNTDPSLCDVPDAAEDRAELRPQTHHVRTLDDYNLREGLHAVEQEQHAAQQHLGDRNSGKPLQPCESPGMVFGDEFERNNPLEDMDRCDDDDDEYDANSFLRNADDVNPLWEFKHWEGCNGEEFEDFCTRTAKRCTLVSIALQIVRTNGGRYELVDALAVESEHSSFEAQLPQDSEFAPFVSIPRCWLEANWLSRITTDRARKLVGLACKGRADPEYRKQMDIFRKVSQSETNTKRDAFRVVVEVVERLVDWFEREERNGKPIRLQEGYVC